MRTLCFLIVILFFCSCGSKNESMKKIVFLHHSTGQTIWRGNVNRYLYKITQKGTLQKLFDRYNKKHTNGLAITQQFFPKSSPYGWHNYPYDYYNIWVKNAGEMPYMEEPTLEMLTKEYDVIIFKHCFPGSNIQVDTDSSKVDSDYKSIANYKLQYEALKAKMHEFPKAKFILWTGAAQVKSQITEEEAKRAKEFFTWVKNEWDSPGDNIFIWDFYSLQTKGDLYFADEFAVGLNDSHPNKQFAESAAQLLFNRIVDVIENNGLKTNLTGHPI